MSGFSRMNRIMPHQVNFNTMKLLSSLNRNWYGGTENSEFDLYIASKSRCKIYLINEH